MDGTVYLILGCVSSGRRAALYDLLKDTASEDSPFTLILPRGEPVVEWDDSIRALENVTLEQYEGGVASVQVDQLNPHHDNVILAPGLASPVDQVEALKSLIDQGPCELGRIITIVSCDLMETHQKLRSWYDACVHFSDVCLIYRGEKTTNQCVQDFIDRYKSQHYPCLFELVGKKGIKNPGLILEPQARRISLFFEPEEDHWLDEEDDGWDQPTEDPYMERFSGGHRKKWVPDIQAILEN